MVFLGVRLPLLASAQVEYAVHRATATPEVVRVVTAMETYAGTLDRLAGTFAAYPQVLTAERAAAIDQAAAALAAERKAVVAEVEAQESRLGRVVADVNGVLDRAERAGGSINASTSRTLATAEGATRRTLDRAFWLALILLLVALLGVPASALMYRRAKGREPENLRSRRLASGEDQPIDALVSGRGH
jgi:hypothetical protein